MNLNLVSPKLFINHTMNGKIHPPDGRNSTLLTKNKLLSHDDNRKFIPTLIQEANAALYFSVLHHGGIYGDMDILPIHHVNPLLHKLNLLANEDKEMIVAKTYNLGLTNVLFASIPNSTVLHQFVKELPLHTRPLWGFEIFIPHFTMLLLTGLLISRVLESAKELKSDLLKKSFKPS